MLKCVTNASPNNFGRSSSSIKGELEYHHQLDAARMLGGGISWHFERISKSRSSQVKWDNWVKGDDPD